MQKTIQLFMWGYQPHFRIEVELRARNILRSIAPTLNPRALLVGIRAAEKKDGHSVCVEPEAEDWDPKLFFGSQQRAEEIYKNHPDHNIFYGDEPSMRDLPENIRKKSALAAVEECLVAYDNSHGTKSFCGWPCKTHDYYVIPILQLEAGQLDAYPSLPSLIEFDRFRAPLSLLNAAIDCLLSDATAALAQDEPGRFLGRREADAPAVLRRAAASFCQAITLFSKDVMFQDLFEPLNIISSIPYEGAGAIGEIIFAPGDSQAIETLVKFNVPVPLSRHRLARKIIEITGQALSSICHGSEGIAGLGNLRPSGLDHVLRVAFTGHYAWGLYYDNILLMNVSYGVPALPLPRLSRTEFLSSAKRIFENFSDAEADRLWPIVEAAMEQRHGTMLVFSSDAKGEAERLKKQSIGIEPAPTTPELVRRITGIDGAMLLSPDGICHGISVILDGIATEAGDPSRGARYNSALRYLSSAEAASMCLVVSKDGNVDLLPQLRPQVLRSDITSHINVFKTKDKNDYHKTLKWLEDQRFYLDAFECSTVNAEIKRIFSSPLEVGELRFDIREFIPHPGMDETYYLPEQ